VRPWEAEERIDEILDFAELGEFGDQPLSTYSSGMQARLAFSVITTLEPEVLVLDEALATGDAGFAEKCKRHIRKLCTSGCTTVVASHDLEFVKRACDSVLWIDHGKIRDRGEPERTVREYQTFLQSGLEPEAPRGPRSVLVRLESEDPARGHAFIVYGFAWLGPNGLGLSGIPIGYDPVFDRCAEAALEHGFTYPSARAGWGPTQKIGADRQCRACRPDLGPGGAAYICLPLLREPEPLPTKLRIRIYQGEDAPPLKVSLHSNGRSREVARVQKSQEPWPVLDIDVASFFQDEGRASSAVDDARLVLPPGVDL
jgi:ABC-type glutathione transport system ATPase component